MPNQDLAKMHPTPAEWAQLDSLFQQMQAVLAPYLRNLSPAENKKYGHVKESNKLLINKVRDLHLTNPALQSGDVDWPEFDRDYASRMGYETNAIKLESLAKAMSETRRMHDYDNYACSRIDYHYAVYKNRLAPGLGYDSKVKELQKFFAKSSNSTISDGIEPI